MLKVRSPCRMSCRGAPAANAAAAAAREFCDVHPGAARERRRQQVGEGQLHVATAVAYDDHLASLGRLEHERLAATTTVRVDHVALLRPGLGHREPDDLPGAAASHLAHQRVVGVEHGVAVAGDRLDEDGLDVGELLDGVDAPQAEVVGLHVEHDGHVVALVAEALAQDAAARHLEDREVHARVLQHHPGAARTGGVGADQQALVDDDAVGRGHADLAAHALEDVADHPAGGGLAVGAGDGDDRDPARCAGREQHVDDRLGDELRLADGRVRVHPEAGRRVHLADRAAGLAHRLGDVGTDEVDAGDVQPDHPGRLLGDLDVLGVRLEGAVDRDAAGRHVAGQGQLDHLALGRHRAQAVPLVGEHLLGGGVDLDPGQDLLVAHAAARVGVGQVDQLLDRSWCRRRSRAPAPARRWPRPCRR